MGEKSTSTILELENSSQANITIVAMEVKLRRLVYSGEVPTPNWFNWKIGSRRFVHCSTPVTCLTTSSHYSEFVGNFI